MLGAGALSAPRAPRVTGQVLRESAKLKQKKLGYTPRRALGLAAGFRRGLMSVCWNTSLMAVCALVPWRCVYFSCSFYAVRCNLLNKKRLRVPFQPPLLNVKPHSGCSAQALVYQGNAMMICVG